MAIKVHNSFEDYHSFNKFIVEIRGNKKEFDSLTVANRFFREYCVEDSYLYAVSPKMRIELAKCTYTDGLKFTSYLYTYLTCEQILEDGE